MKKILHKIDSSTTFFFAILMLFLGLRALPVGEDNNTSVKPKELNYEVFLPDRLDREVSCKDEVSNITYLP